MLLKPVDPTAKILSVFYKTLRTAASVSAHAQGTVYGMIVAFIDSNYIVR